MSFISVLKKIGQVANTADQFIPVYGPMIHGITASINPNVDAKATAVIDTTTNSLQQIESLVVQVEAMGTAIKAPGPQKAAMIAPAAFQLLSSSLALTKGKTPKDPEAARSKAAAVAAAIADFINEYEVPNT